MNKNNETAAPDVEEGHWISTYGVLTAKRMFDLFKIELTYDELVDAVKSPENQHHELLRVPFKHVFNGIIQQQTHDWQVYAQKLFVDYLLSGQPDKAADAAGANVRGKLEKLRVLLAQLGEQFETHQFEQKRLIAESQSELMQVTAELPLDLQKVSAVVGKYLGQAEHFTALFCDYRTRFHDLAEEAIESMRLLQDYHMDEVQQTENKAAVEFDSTLGE